ncbi:MAG TPA: penicillin-binding protein 2 [Opitutaceae bacterium]|nr:penicillin-binding protein 2 [Opitutaceae bacterium]
MSRGFTSSPRIALLAGVILLTFAGIGFRLVQLHVIDRDERMKFVVKARRQIIPENARRGDILDARGSVLATSRPQVELGVDPQVVVKEDEAKWPELARLLGLPLPRLQEIMTTRRRKVEPHPADVAAPATVALETVPKPDAPAAKPAASFAFNFTLPAPAADAAGPATDESDDTVLDDTPDEGGYRLIQWAKLSDHVDEETYAKIAALDVRGVYGPHIYRRNYPHNGLAAHLIGYVNKAGEPATGMEAYADFYLRGRNGWREGERDGRGRELAQFRTREVPRADGYNVMLSIDSNVQSIIEDELADIARKYEPQKATIVVSDPRTGFVLGLANYPSYDLNEYSKPGADGHVDLAAQRNVAVTDQYEPGSVFKIVAASGALEEGLVTSASQFDCSIDRIDYKGRTRSLPPEDHHFEDPKHVSLAEIISYSSNRGAAQLAMKMGEDDFCRYASLFGFGERTGFPVGGEIAGTMHKPGSPGWDGQTITRMPMGHSVSVTVMQMHQAMSVIANGGVLLRPQIIRQITDPSGEVVTRYDRPVEVRRVISGRTAQIMAQLLMGVASPHGTAPKAAIPNFQIAGKTGTTQKIINGKYSDRHHVASFVGFFPASRPELAISVIVDDADAHAPGGVAYGAEIAAPAFKHVAEQLIQYRDIKPVYEPGRGMLVMEGGRR